jgi:hypothetical protein
MGICIVTHRPIARQGTIHAAKNTEAVLSVGSDPRLYNRSQSERTVSRSKRTRMERVLVICEVGRLPISNYD